ncbi:hypothetical protein L0U85_17475 [Glycomyces sp. L485]|uniref:hypothetical protein n=1 Tax=Glycomyces sp. L485 TaxID=2909235 RepID=UPI001F4AEB63|nr:hypothetical protein [Glycomyces sp. L485]MCH7232627.1 hypothetical protein [Glycomyces sp. L485]
MQFLDDSNVAAFLAEDGPRLLVFGLAADLSSQVFGKQLTELEQDTYGRVAIGLVDIAQAPRTAAEWGVTKANLPVQVLFTDGIMQRVLLGVRSTRGLLTELKEYLDTPQT